MRFFLFATLVLTAMMPVAASAAVSDHWPQMLEGLKERRFFDTALQYVGKLHNGANCPASLKEQFDFQVGMIHLHAVKQNAPFLPFDEHLKLCRESLEKFLAANPDGEKTYETHTILGQLDLHDGQNVAGMQKDAQAHGNAAADKDTLLLHALSHFEAADKLATEQAKKLQLMRKADKESVTDAELQAAYGRFLSGKIHVQLAKSARCRTFPPDSDEYRIGLKEVAATLEKMATTYRDYSVAFEAKLQAAKTFQALGDFAKARELLGELNALRGDEFVTILSESLKMALEMNLAEKTPACLQDSMRRFRVWHENAPEESKDSSVGQEILLLGAKSILAYAETIKQNKKVYDQSILEATALLRRPRRVPLTHLAREADSLLRELGVEESDKTVTPPVALPGEKAENDWQVFAAAFRDYQAASPEERNERKKSLDELAWQFELSTRHAINLHPSDSTEGEKSRIRHNLVTAYYAQDKILEAAILSDFLVRRSADTPDFGKTALQATQLYRQAFVRESETAPLELRSAIADRLKRLGRFILQHVENRDHGAVIRAEVSRVLMRTALDLNRIEEARELYNALHDARIVKGDKTVPPQQIALELEFGLSLWNEYIQNSPTPDLDRDGEREWPPAATMRKQELTQIGETLESALAYQTESDALAVQSAMVLGQICLLAGENRQAVDWLTHSRFGPLASNNKVSLEVKLGALLTALRAYVGIENLDQAEETMNQLETIIQEQSADEKKVTQIYISLGRQLEDRLKELHASGDTEQAKKVAAGFELFLLRIRQRGRTNTFQSLYWVADTFIRLGGGLESGQKYYAEAAQTYENILKRIADEPDWAQKNATESIQVRLAETQRFTGQFESALKTLDKLLEKSRGRIDLQAEAARTLEAWGRQEPKRLVQAVTGGFPSKNVWGWNGLIRRTSTDVDRFADVYYESYLGRFRCVLQSIEKEQDAKKREKLLAEAKRDFETLKQLRPELGGQKWREKFEKIDETIISRSAGSAAKR